MTNVGYMIEWIEKACYKLVDHACNVEKTEEICGGNNFVFNAFLYLQPVQRSENMVKTGGPGSCNNSTSILDVPKAIQLQAEIWRIFDFSRWRLSAMLDF